MRVFLIGLLIIVVSCNIFEDDLESQNLFVEFSVYHFSLDKSLTINEYGSVSITSTLTELNADLSEVDFNHLKKLLHRFRYIDYEYTYYCDDGLRIKIDVTENGNTHTIEVDACAFDSTSVSQTTELERLDSIISELIKIYDKVYNSTAPWLGLEYSVFVEKDTYLVGEPIIVDYSISNPTESVREAWFYLPEKILFDITALNTSDYLSFQFPDNFPSIFYEPTSLIIQPGEMIAFQYEWDQQFVKDAEIITAKSGTYSIYASVLVPDYIGDWASIEIIEH